MPDGCKTAKVFMIGRSQAVRLPKEFRFDCDEVRIRKEGCILVLEPMPEDWSWLDGVVGTLDADFVQAALEHPGEQPRAELDRLAR